MSDHAALPSHLPESRYAWLRLALAVFVGTIICVSTWSVAVVLPVVEAEFGTARGGASLPYTMVMLGFGAGTILMGHMSDKLGIVKPLIIGAVLQFIGYGLAGVSQNLWQYALLHFIIGVGGANGFGPLISDTSHWFTRNRGLAITLAASGSYLAGVVWPFVIQALVQMQGWRMAHILIGTTSLLLVVPLSVLFRPQPNAAALREADEAHAVSRRQDVLSPRMVQIILTVAGFSCCVAMAMPQVHLVAYCGDLGYGTARGVEMLALMLALGIISRVGSGYVADRIGGVMTLLIGSMMQGIALFLYLLFNGLTSLYLISAIFGLFQGGIVPMYAVIIRSYMPPAEAGARIGIVMAATTFGMAAGGYLSGFIFDLTGSYRAAFLHGMAWNLLNLVLIGSLLLRSRTRLAKAA